MNQPVFNQVNTLANANASTNAFITFFAARDPTTNDTEFPVQKRWFNTATNSEWILVSFSTIGGITTANWKQISGGPLEVQFLKGNTGGNVGPDGTGVINVIGDTTTINIAGNPGTNTLTASASGALATTYTEDSGTAAPSANNLNVLGGTGIATSGAGNTVTISTTAAVATTYTEDSGTATSSAHNLNIFGAHGINTLGSGATVTVAINNAITLGDLTPIAPGSDALTATTGNITITAGDLNLPVTNSTGTQGVINMGGLKVLHIGGGANNFWTGTNAGNFTNTGIRNTGCGWEATISISTGSDNSGFGQHAIKSVTTGNNNTGCGSQAGINFTTGSDNTLLGFQAGANYTTSESSNICIGSIVFGTVSESNTIRIGAGTGASAGEQNRCFISGIRGITTTNADAVAVLIDSANQLGTVSSSIRFKTNVQDMKDSSARVLDLRPVTFNWKDSQNTNIQYGLIAEEALDIFPELVVMNKEGTPETIKYHILPVLLLNELKKCVKKIEMLENELSNLRSR